MCWYNDHIFWALTISIKHNVLCVQIMTATVETVTEQLDLAPIIPPEKVVAAVARAVTLTDTDVGKSFSLIYYWNLTNILTVIENSCYYILLHISKFYFLHIWDCYKYIIYIDIIWIYTSISSAKNNFFLTYIILKLFNR